MTIRSSRAAFLRHHVCELLLLVALAVPVIAVRFSGQTILIVAVFLVALLGLGYVTDMSSVLRVDDDGIAYLEGGRDQRYLAWSEVAEIVPRRFRGWPAEDALVALGRDGRPLLVAGVSMFERDSLVDAMRVAGRYVDVTHPVILSPFTARAEGRRRPELAPQRTSERLLVSSVGGMLAAGLVALIIFAAVEL